MRYSLFFILLLSFSISSYSQQSDVQLKYISDTCLREQRALTIPSDTLDAWKVLLKLFPGKFYSLPYSDKTKNKFISWRCKSCKPSEYIDMNGDGNQSFPYKDGVATRLLKVLNYKDGKGNEFKLLTFSHSEYDPDGLQTGRFTGGLLGVAKFAKIDGVWQMRSFQPAIAAFGAFSSCPDPELIMIGEDQYALGLISVNGGAGGPFIGYSYLIAGVGGKYKVIFESDEYLVSGAPKGETTWNSITKAPDDGQKQYFRDIIVTTKGYYKNNFNPAADDYTAQPPQEVTEFLKNKKSLNFSIVKRYIYDGKHYVVKDKPVVTVSNVK